MVFWLDIRRKSKRYSAFGGNSPFGKLEAYIKLEQLGEGSYATVFKGTTTTAPQNEKKCLRLIDFTTIFQPLSSPAKRNFFVRPNRASPLLP